MILQLIFQSFYMVIFISFLITAGCLFYLWQWTHYLQAGYRVQELTQQKEAIQQQLELLEIEINYLSRPQRLEAIAAQSLKMIPQKTSQYVILDAVMK